jgi:hypothetical protein
MTIFGNFDSRPFAMILVTAVQRTLRVQCTMILVTAVQRTLRVQCTMREFGNNPGAIGV